MINSANKYIIADIFSENQKIRYSIPKYQREYSRGKDHWDYLLNDIRDSEGNHFIGSIICIQNTLDSYNPVLELVDGQQRLTTLSLLFCAIYKHLSDRVEDDDEELKHELYNLKFKLIGKEDKLPKIELSEQNFNYSDYQSILSEIGIYEYYNDVKHRGLRQIFRAYRHFLSELENTTTDEIVTLLKKIYGTILVKIEVGSHSDAFMLFESLNNRGKPLSAIDLIKNKLLAEIERNNIMDIDSAFNKRKKLVGLLDEYSVQERYLRHYYNAYKTRPDIRVEKQSRATRSNLIKIYEQLISRDTEKFFNDLLVKAKTYASLLYPNDSENEVVQQITKELTDLIRVKAAPSYLFLLYVFSEFDGLQGDYYKQLVSLLVSYFIRRNITDFPNTRNLDKIFIELVEILENDRSKNSIEYITDYLKHPDRCSSDEEFRKALSGDLYEINTDATRFILAKIEEKYSTDETIKDFWERKSNNKLLRTIEHIFPEGKNIPSDRIDMIGNGDKDYAENIQEKRVHKLGNLTLTGFNQHLSNFKFTKKRDRQEKGNYIGYKNGLYLNRELAIKNEWTAKDIQDRTILLVNEAMTIFSI